MRHIPLLLAAVCALALAACEYLDSSRPPAPSDSPALGAATGGSVPTAGVPAAQTGTALPADTDTAITGPDGAIWRKSGASSERYRADADNCYSFARGQVAHDRRIEDDAGAAFNETERGDGLTELRQRMTQFARENRLPRLFGQCMEAKGYTRG